MLSLCIAKCRKMALPALIALNLFLLVLLCHPYPMSTPAASPADVQVYLTPAEVELPILMYHDILKNPARQQPYVISPAKLEQDLRYLQESGYHTVVVEDIVAFVEEGKPLPDKPIMITFDDGYYNNVFYAGPLLQKYNMRAVMFVVGAFCEKAVEEGEENPNYSYVQWARLSQMAGEGSWDVQSHSWNMHEVNGKRMGIQRRPNQSEQAYVDALQSDFSQITNKLTEVIGTRPLAFAYPYGAMDDRAEAVLKELGYKVTMCSTSGKSILRVGHPETLYRLCRLARVSNKSARFLLER